MKWDQIENKWALMTRRIRGDFGDQSDDAAEGSVYKAKHHDTLTATIADVQVSAVTDPEFKNSVK